MNPMMMMMMMPQLMGHQSSENPMNGLVMASLMKKMQSSSSSESDYDYDYDYDYTYGSDGSSGSSEYDYEYDYDYEESDPTPNPLSDMIRQMLQSKMSGASPSLSPFVQLTLIPSEAGQLGSAEADSTEATDSTEAEPVEIAPTQKEIAPPTRTDKEVRPNEQVSYRNAP